MPRWIIPTMATLPHCLSFFIFYFCTLADTEAQYYGLYAPNYPPSVACTPVQRTYFPKACVDHMKLVMSDTNAFWFGKRYEQQCASIDLEEKNPNCRKIGPEDGERFAYQNLGSHMFQDPEFDASKVDEYLGDLVYPLTVTYTSMPGSTSFCNSTIVYNQVVRFDANPNMAPMTDFHYRNAPLVYAPTCTNTTLCTLMFFDVGLGAIHNIWINWPRDNPTLSDYISPGLPRLDPNPYAWIVFQQPGEITDYEPPDLATPFSVNLKEFIEQYALTGPVGMTWLLATMDMYGLNQLQKFGLPAEAFCGTLLDIQLQADRFTLAQDIGLTPPIELKAWIPVKYNSNGLETWLGPMQNRELDTTVVASEPEIMLFLKLNPAEAEDFSSRIYTLALVRRDAMFPTGVAYGTLAAEPATYLHWMKINIPGNSLSEGTEIFPYLGPNVPGRYYLLLYLQNGDIEEPDLTANNPNCVNGQDLRCRSFRLMQFVRDNNLKLEALNRFQLINRPPVLAYYAIPYYG